MKHDNRPRNYRKDTLLTHVGRNPEANHGVVNPPVYHASPTSPRASTSCGRSNRHCVGPVASDIPHMTTRIVEVYDALLAAGSPEDKARKAAEAIAAYENRFTAMDQRFAKIEGDLKLLT
jgi:hypothetical protein